MLNENLRQVQFAVQPGAIPGKLIKKKFNQMIKQPYLQPVRLKFELTKYVKCMLTEDDIEYSRK